MIHQTKGIVLRTIKYGETSIVVNIFTELFGIQSYLVNGVRSSGKTLKANFFQPASILEMEVYHNELKNLQRIKEFKWCYLYKSVLTDVTKNSVALYMVELLQKCLKQPETNVDLFEFTEDAFMQLDMADNSITANYPLYFCLHLSHFFGLKLEDDYSEINSILDLQEGRFIKQAPHHQHYLQSDQSFYISQLLKVQHPDELTEIKLNKAIRKKMLFALQNFYGLHIQDFGTMKTLPILHEVLAI
ncbi:MAG: DNA repair protein RecO [Chitinophagaceae bacterium]|nr:DNA repair protein RecO [Chitinophagaceae bacterium]